MTKRTSSIRRRVLTLAVAAVCVVAIAGTALAGHQTSGVKSYTGCLVSGDGVMIKIKEGNSPRSACTGGQVEAHFSGGDISKISVGSGLSLPNGGDNGEVRIELAAGQTLPSNCTAGRVAEWNGSAWVCGIDNDTTYAAGTGLDLSSSNTFSVEPAYQVKNTTDCPSGQFATGFDVDGDIQCAAPSGAPQSYRAVQAAYTIIVKDDDTFHDVVRLDLPAGKFVLMSSGTIGADTPDGTSDGSCYLTSGNIVPDAQQFVDDDAESAATGSVVTVSLNGIATLATAGSVAVQCKAFSAADQALASEFEIIAIRVS